MVPLHRALGPQWGQQAGWGTAAKNRTLAVVRFLLDKRANVHAMTKIGQTPEDLARALGQQEVVALLRAAKRRAECEAFAMGHQERLGAGSLVQSLDAEVVRMILDPA